jgi:hypothetical protein
MKKASSQANRKDKRNKQIKLQKVTGAMKEKKNLTK